MKHLNYRWVFFIGPEKTGTSTIHHLLKKESRVLLPKSVKETFFFDKLHSRGHDWYLQRYDMATIPYRPFDCIFCEVAPSYFNSASVADRIKNFNSRAEVVVTLREPRARAWSHFLHLVRYGLAPNNLKDAIVDRPSIINASRYDLLLPYWRSVFSDGMEVIVLEEARLDWKRALDTVLNIGDTAIAPIGSDEAHNSAANPRSRILSGVITSAAQIVRNLGGYEIVNKIRDTGLKEWVYSGGEPTPRYPTERDKALLTELIPESAVDVWKDSWQELRL